MKARFYAFWDDIGEFITSRAIVMIVMVPFMWYRFFEFETLFIKWLPIPDLPSRQLAARLISLVLITMTLLFMVNVKRLFRGIKYLLAFTAFTLNMFFWSLDDELNWWFILFISALIASMDYGQAHLFDVMWREKKGEENLKEFGEQIKDQEQILQAIKYDIDFLEPTHNEFIRIREQCYCEACDRTFPSPQSKNAHKCKPQSGSK